MVTSQGVKFSASSLFFEVVTPSLPYIISKDIKVQRGEGTGWGWKSKVRGRVGAWSHVSCLPGGPSCSSSAAKRLFPERLSNRTAASGRCTFSTCSAFSTCRWQLNTAAIGSLTMIKFFPNPGRIMMLPMAIALVQGSPWGLWPTESMWTTQNK